MSEKVICSELASAPFSTGVETMPLITHRNYDKEDGHYMDTTVGTTEEQRDADMIWHKAKEKEWREKEAEWLARLSQAMLFEKLSLDDPRTKLVTHIAELRQISEEE